MKHRPLIALLAAAPLAMACQGLKEALTAHVDVVAFWGGIEIKVPAGWTVDARVVPLLGAFENTIREHATGPGGSDCKTRLQELAAQVVDQLPRYQVRHEGPDHSKRFFASVQLRGRTYGTGEGRSKKAAEQSAARQAWERLQREARGDSIERGRDA